MRSDWYQIFLIALGIAATALLGVFFYREIFPEYLIYQDDYIALEKFRSTYTHEPPPVFKRGIKQILIEKEDKGNPTIDRCISCHVALQFSHFSPTKIAKDINGNIVYDAQGIPVKVANEDYVWARLDAEIGKLEDPKEGDASTLKKRLDQAHYYSSLKTAEVGDYVYDVTKVLAMHPLLGKETRPFEFHPVDDYGCVSCHNGNGRGLVTDRAHGPVFDEQYEAEYQGEFPKFTEADPLNDPKFARMFNFKPGPRLIFQTKPVLVGALIQAKCVQCHQASGVVLQSAANTALLVTDKKEKEMQALAKTFASDQAAFLELIALQQQIQNEGYDKALEQLQTKEKDYTLSLAESEKISSQIKYLKSLASKTALETINQQIIAQLGSAALADKLEKLLKKGAEQQVLTQFLIDHQTDPDAKGSLFIKLTTINLEKSLNRHVKDVERSFTQSVKDQAALSSIMTDIDRLTLDYRQGQHLFLSQSCYACHRIAGYSRGGVGPELTKSGETYPWYLKQKLVWPQADLRNSTMPEMQLDHEELEYLMTFLLGQEGENKAVSSTTYKTAVMQWENGRKLPWEEPVTPVQIHDVRFGMTVFATEGCASCHRLKGYESDVGFKIEKGKPSFDDLYKEHQWFSTLFPEEIYGTEIVAAIDKHAAEIDAKISPDVRQNSILEEIEKNAPGTIEAFYSNFKYAMRAKNHFYTAQAPAEKDFQKKQQLLQELSAWQERVRRVFLLYVQEYGLGRLICPRPNWSGVYRTDEWLMEHFHSPTSHTPRSIMPVFPFDETKFYALTYMLDILGKKNRDAVRAIWKNYGFNPELAFEIHCSQCHGPYLQGNGPVAEWIYPIPKNLRKADFLRNLTKERAIDSIHHGVKGTPMPPWGEAAMDKPMADGIPELTEDEIKILVNWIYSSLPGGTFMRTEEDVPKWQYTPQDVLEELKKEGNDLHGKEGSLDLQSSFIAAVTPVFAQSDADENSIFNTVPAPAGEPDPFYYYIKKKYYTPQNLQSGEAFFNLNCAVCHGKDADGSGVRAEAMQDAKPRMLTNLDWINTRDDLRLLRSIKYGVPGTAITPWGDLTSSLQRLQLVMYIRSLSEDQEVRSKLLTSLYQAYENTIRQVEAVRVKEYVQLQKAQGQYDQARDLRRQLDDEVRQGKPEAAKAILAYEQELAADAQLKQRNEIDQQFQDLAEKIQNEEDLYKSVGLNLMVQKAGQELMDEMLKAIHLNEGRLEIKDGRLIWKEAADKEKQIANILQQMVQQIDQKVEQLKQAKVIAEGKIYSQAINTEQTTLSSTIASWEKLKALAARNFEEAALLRQQQQELLKKLNSELKP